MKSFEEIYREKVMTADEALELIKDGDYMFSAQAAGEPAAILSHLQHLKETGVKNTTINTCLPLQYYDAFKDPEMQGVMSHNGWFFSPGLRDAHKKKLVSAIPQSSTSVLRKVLSRLEYEKRRPVVLATVSPMDSHGYMSLSVSAIYERDLINSGALTILEVNPNFPRTFGDTQVHVSEADALVESDRPIPVSKVAPYTEVDAEIGKYVASLVEDGSTIQLGIGNIPNAVAAELKSKKHLGIHTEMFTETMVDLIECGAVDNSRKGLLDGYSVCSFTMGSKRLYDYIDNNPAVLFKSCTFTNDPYTIGLNNRFVSVNATLEVDLTGQCASETVGHDQWSGTGGQSETVQGSQMSKGGKSIIAMHSTYKAKDENGGEALRSKIVPFLHEGAVVTTSRNDTDYIVTEYGIAWLRGKNVAERAEALISIAHPDFRDELREKAKEYGIW
ncbi:acetyl-CoA hydrolase/transferase C-terminal domain-containing protein [[Clostridium] symbiosum]|uniref:acetyl-CoA hydrolase/transferase family protein n=1 Tax=Clostridium symbiosum TaxID=1512 RepID=UPI001D05C78B|nr:acetyl-CoA hydrolase/transferase C-terminal domain-containing protein [[Clostridium] symbiosum]MCB6607537.1 4-hydroxybutyrate--acetyl-CoA CoA transferase [[Clostridium] symbiosum]MCB6930717.1 4-hydroxybutyrate--acetyl-CoA CoA transferase [[Clostridium] symbiosum]